jgi:hypothetical protein
VSAPAPTPPGPAPDGAGLARLREACAHLLERGEADPAAAGRLADGVQTLLSAQRSPSRRTGRRAAPRLDPFEIYRQDPDLLEARLAALELEQLRDIVAHYAMDPRKLVMKWKTRDKVVGHIVEQVQASLRKGDVFRAPERSDGERRGAA